MADRRDYYFKQLVTESELDQGFNGSENADRSVVKEIGLDGITAAIVSQNSPTPDISVNVQDLFSYDKDGQRVVAQGLNNVDLNLDFASNPTAVVTPGNEKFLTLFVEFERALSDPRLDGNNDTVFFVRNESFNFVVKQGAESAPDATRVAAEADKQIVADIKLIFGQSQVLDADIDITRRESLITTSTDLVIGPTIKEAISDLADFTDALITMGINEKYRRQSTKVVGANLDTAGDGAAFLRDGIALTAQIPNSADYTIVRQPDPFAAAFSAEIQDFTKTSNDRTSGGDIGLVGFVGYKESDDVLELSSGNSLTALLASYIPRDITGATLESGTARTFIPKGAAATLNVAGADPDLVTLTAPHYFATGNTSAVRQNEDLLLVTFADSTQQAYLLDWINGDASDEATLTTMAGAPAVFASDVAVTVQWFSALFSAGSYPWIDGGGDRTTALSYFEPQKLRTGGAFSVSDLAPKFIGRTFYDTTDTADGPSILLTMGYTDVRAEEHKPLKFLSDSSIISRGVSLGALTTRSLGRLEHALGHRFLNGTGGSSDQAFRFDPANKTYDGVTALAGAGFSVIAFNPSGTADETITVTINTDPADLEDGMLFEFIVNNEDGLNFTMVWDSEFTFSDPSDAQLGASNGAAGAGSIVRWEGIVYGSQILMKRTAY